MKSFLNWVHDLFVDPDREPARAHKFANFRPVVEPVPVGEIEGKLRDTWKKKIDREAQEKEVRLEAKKPKKDDMAEFAVLAQTALNTMIANGVIEVEVPYFKKHPLGGHDISWSGRFTQDGYNTIRWNVIDKTYSELERNKDQEEKDDHGPTVCAAVVDHLLQNGWKAFSSTRYFYSLTPK